MKDIIRIGVVGCGVMGQHHLRILKRIPYVETIGVVDIDQHKADQAALRFQTDAFYDYRWILDKKPDIVDVVVPTSLHTQVALDALDAGCHIIVEKPLADSIEGGKKIVRKAASTGKKLMVGHIERFNPAVTQIKQVLDEGLLGRVASIHSRRAGPYSPRTYDVGVILDLGTHDIDIISYLYGERVRSVYAVAGSERHQHEDHATLLLRFNNGKAGIIDVNWLVPYKIRNLSLIGRKGVGTLDFLQQQVTILDSQWSREIKVDRGEPLFLEIKHFVDVVRTGKEPAVSGEDSLHALAVALKAMESAKKHQLIEIDARLFNDKDLHFRR